MVSREGGIGTEEEDFNKGRLGKDFTKATTLSIAEAYHILDRERRKPNFQSNPRFDQTFEYVTRFNRYPNKEVTKNIRAMLERYKLQDFETSALWNLCPESPAAARELIPSLSEKFDGDEELKQLLEELQNARTLAQPGLLTIMFKLRLIEFLQFIGQKIWVVEAVLNVYMAKRMRWSNWQNAKSGE
eukprot:TRINITY_DN121915_c0_g1_i1.p2 TRINITY_DN121915_c0_g1~~TRINITY_DN121915_c0_g1_i1.p2  ORF type:complete len:187 (-),score=16.52 TRINITY_DN121915_c0_g1_i1:243-803(-)